jgi:hypothetical protein
VNAPNFAAEANDLATGVDRIRPSAAEQRHSARREQTFDTRDIHERLRSSM